MLSKMSKRRKLCFMMLWPGLINELFYKTLKMAMEKALLIITYNNKLVSIDNRVIIFAHAFIIALQCFVHVLYM